MKIFLDDDPARDSWVDDTWTIVRTAKDAIAKVWALGNQIEVLSLDHDLGDDENGTGYDVLKFIEDEVGQYGLTEIIPQKIEIHSANPVGRKNMQAAIDSIERMRRHD